MSTEATWTLRFSNKVLDHELGKGEASFPGKDTANQARQQPDKQVRLRVGNRSAMFWTSVREAASGNEIYIRQDAFVDNISNNSLVNVEPLPRWRYLLHVALKEPGQRLALIGLCIALFGLGIEMAFAVGQIWPLIRLGVAVNVVLISISWLMKALGLGLVFWKGLTTSRP